MKKTIMFALIGLVLIGLSSAQQVCQTYDDFSSGVLDSSKWEVRQDTEGQPLMDEGFVMNGTFHTQQNSAGDRRTYLFPKINFSTGDSIEYDVNVVSHSGNYGNIVLLFGNGLYRVALGMVGYNGGPQPIDELGISHMKLSFSENNLAINRTAPSGVSVSQDFGLPLNGAYELYMGSFTGHDGMAHLDYDNFRVCREEISSDCIIPYDQMNINNNTILCQGEYFLPNGININANNITLDCNYSKISGNNSNVLINSGIFLAGKSNVIVENCNIKNYLWAINIENGSDNIFRNNSISSSGIGFLMGGSSSNIFAGNSLFSLAVGFRVISGSDSNLFVNNNISFSRDYGFFLDDSNRNEIKNNIISSSGFAGIRIGYSGGLENGSIIVENTIVSNQINNNRDGVRVSRGQQNFKVIMQNNTLSGNNEYGVWLGGCSSRPCINSQIIFQQNKVSYNGWGVTYVNGYCADNLSLNNIYNNQQSNLEIIGSDTDTGYFCNSNWTYNWWGSSNLANIVKNISGNTAIIPFKCTENSNSLFSNSTGVCLIDTDSDSDGVLDSIDKCPNTILPEVFSLKKYRFGDIDGDRIFEKKNVNKKIVNSIYSLNSTFGCSCKQILDTMPKKYRKTTDEYANGCKKATIVNFINKF